MGSNLASGKIFTASVSSVDSLYPSVSLDPSGFHLRTKYMQSIEKEPIYDVYCFSHRQYQRFLNILFWDVSVAQLVAPMPGVVLGGVAKVVEGRGFESH